MHILLVEDDELLGEGIRSGLVHHQYAVSLISDGLDAWVAIQREQFDLVILDLGLPRLSGEAILKNMRAGKISTPVIILTGHTDIHQRDGGADDYVTKPFSLEELCARIRVVHRRVALRSSNAPITVGNVTLDPITKLVFKDGEMIELSHREFGLLQMLLENFGKVLSKEQVIQDLYGWDRCVGSNVLEVYMHSLRKKLKCRNIVTVRGVGYVLIGVNQGKRVVFQSGCVPIKS